MQIWMDYIIYNLMDYNIVIFSYLDDKNFTFYSILLQISMCQTYAKILQPDTAHSTGVTHKPTHVHTRPT